jgi:hypothetical protein
MPPRVTVAIIPPLLKVSLVIAKLLKKPGIVVVNVRAREACSPFEGVSSYVRLVALNVVTSMLSKMLQDVQLSPNVIGKLVTVTVGLEALLNPV